MSVGDLMEPSFEVNLTWGAKIKELDSVKKKKTTINALFGSEQISKSTYEYLEKKLTDEIVGIETNLKLLSDSMTARAKEIEEQIVELEISFANLEMYHATGEIDEKTYEGQNKAILLRLEAAKQELENAKNSLLNVLSETVEPMLKPEIENLIEEQSTPTTEKESEDMPVKSEGSNLEVPCVTAEAEMETNQGIEEEKALDVGDEELAERTVAPTQIEQKSTVEDASGETGESVSTISIDSADEVSAQVAAEQVSSSA